MIRFAAADVRRTILSAAGALAVSCLCVLGAVAPAMAGPVATVAAR